MVKQTKIKFKNEISSGKVNLKLGSIDIIPFENESFSKVFTVNTLYFWPTPENAISEVYNVLKPGGKFVVAYRSKKYIENMKLDNHGFTSYDASEFENLLSKSKFNKFSIDFFDQFSFIIFTVPNKNISFTSLDVYIITKPFNQPRRC